MLFIGWANITNRPSKSNSLKNKFLYFSHNSAGWVFRLMGWLSSIESFRDPDCSISYKFWLLRHHHPDWLEGQRAWRSIMGYLYGPIWPWQTSLMLMFHHSEFGHMVTPTAREPRKCSHVPWNEGMMDFGGQLVVSARGRGNSQCKDQGVSLVCSRNSEEVSAAGEEWDWSREGRRWRWGGRQGLLPGASPSPTHFSKGLAIFLSIAFFHCTQKKRE